MKKKKLKTKKRKLTKAQLMKAILYLLRQNPKKVFNPNQASKKLQAKNSKESIQQAFEKLVESNKVIALGDYKYKFKSGSRAFGDRKSAEGTVDMTRTGAAYIECEGLDTDIYVAAKNLHSALNGDKVQIQYWTPRGRRKPEGEVVKIIQRTTDIFVGTVRMHKLNAFVIPSRMDVNFEIFVDLNDLKDAADGDKVAVKITQWPKNSAARPKGVVTAVLGQDGSDLEMNVILINSGFNIHHEEASVKEAESFPDQIPDSEIQKRRDFRNVLTFTIDPIDAKDFDDALSIEFLDNDHVEIGVHIADVTYYVTPGSNIDNEAYKRSTSVYLVDRTFPMLPERLSNNLCSLRPLEDRLTFSAVFEFDNNRKLVNRWFGKGIIHSNRRFAYEEAQDIMDSGNGDFSHELKFINRVAKRLRKDRFRNGAIDFDMDEVRFHLDEEGVPVEIYVKERKDAHTLIEEYMLLANREVATYINKKAEGQSEIPFVYRVHDFPDPDKVAELATFAKELGFHMNIGSPKSVAKSYNKLAEAAEKDQTLQLLQPIAIRTMAKAEYSAKNIGHYGLAFNYYTHFTSPIRRYSDILSHRILEKNLGNDFYRTDKMKLEEKCKHISAQERKAMTAERESIKYKQVEFMAKHVGEVFEGLISGMIDRGFFVELKDSKCEGMVGFDSLSEPFQVEDGRLKAKGMRSGKMLKMGDLVKVQIVKTDLDRRQIDMELVEE